MKNCLILNRTKNGKPTDRLARSTKELLNICDKINEVEASFKSLSESWADSTSPGGKMIFTIFAGIAEFERELIIERTSAGRKLAMKNGIEFGRPKKFSPKQKVAVKTLVNNGTSVKLVADTFKVHPATIYRILQGKSSKNSIDPAYRAMCCQ